MFEDSLLESRRHTLTACTGWSAATAATLQATALTLMLLYPLMHPESIGHIIQLREPMPVLTPLEPPSHQPLATSEGSVAPPVSYGNVLREPKQIPLHALTGRDPADLFSNGVASCASGCSDASDILNIIGRPAPLGRGTSGPARISHLDEGSVQRRVQPEYPAIAKAAGIQGDVVLRAFISRTGEIENLQLVSGHPALAEAARRAVNQWKFRPYVLDGIPVEVETQITVAFRLSR